MEACKPFKIAAELSATEREYRVLWESARTIRRKLFSTYVTRAREIAKLMHLMNVPSEGNVFKKFRDAQVSSTTKEHSDYPPIPFCNTGMSSEHWVVSDTDTFCVLEFSFPQKSTYENGYCDRACFTIDSNMLRMDLSEDQFRAVLIEYFQGVIVNQHSAKQKREAELASMQQHASALSRELETVKEKINQLQQGV